ncbi:MAG: glycosyltransferase family 87 protein [Acidobacteriota bacterium]
MRFVTLPARATVFRYAAALVIGCVLFVAVRQRRDFWDFEVYRTAGARVMAAESLYRADDGHYQFKYWPAFAIAMSPFARIPLVPAALIWFLISIVLLSRYFDWTIRALPERRLSARVLFWWTLAICFKFIVKELVNGQANVLMALLAFAGAMRVERHRPLSAGVLIGLAVFVKPYALLLIPWLALSAGAAAASMALAVIAAGLLLPVGLYGWAGNLAQLHAWYEGVTQTTAPNLLLPENVSFAAFWGKWIGAGPPALRYAMLTSLSALLVAAAVWWRRRRDGRDAYLEVSLLLLLMPLISPQGWDYVLLIALPAFVLLVDRFPQLGLPWRIVTAAGIALTGFTIFDLLGRKLYSAMMTWSVVTIGGVLLVAALAHVRWRRLA